jgi:mono/diheme cytochrome c family protein
MRYILFLLILFLTPFDGFAQEERHRHKRHGHPGHAKIKNPVAKTEKSVAEGKKLYEKHCTACHGEAGKGASGPALSAPELIHGSTDGEIFHVITDGVAGTAMKGFKKELSDELRWHIVNYIAGLRKTR